MNEYLKKAMEENERRLPQTFEEYGKLHTADARMIPFSHVQKLRSEFDQRKNEEKPTLGKINFIDETK
jgi:hypothetical protein